MKTFSFMLHWKLMTSAEFLTLYLLGLKKCVAMETVSGPVSDTTPGGWKKNTSNPWKRNEGHETDRSVLSHLPSLSQSCRYFGRGFRSGKAKFPKLSCLSLTFHMCSFSSFSKSLTALALHQKVSLRELWLGFLEIPHPPGDRENPCGVAARR